jgi:hypothetical protein
MPFKFNPFTGKLDAVNASSSPPSGTGFYGQQNGRTLIDQTNSAGDTTVNIALNASDYQHGTLSLIIPSSGTFSVGINNSKPRIFTTVNYFSTTTNDAYSETGQNAGFDVYPGYIGTTFWPRAYTSLRDTALSPSILSATGSFASGAPTVPIVFLKSCRINGSNIELVFNGSGAIVFDCFWRVWKIPT